MKVKDIKKTKIIPKAKMLKYLLPMLVIVLIAASIKYIFYIFPQDAAKKVARQYAEVMWVDGDYEGAKTYMSKASLEWEKNHTPQTAETYAKMFDAEVHYRIQTVSYRPGLAVVTVEITPLQDVNFENSEAACEYVALVKEGGDWKVDVYQSILAEAKEDFGEKDAEDWVKKMYPAKQK